MPAEGLTAVAEERTGRLYLRVAWLCGLVLFLLEGYDIAAVGYAIPAFGAALSMAILGRVRPRRMGRPIH